MKKIDDDTREFIESQIDNVQLYGLCPICKTGRSQNGECWRGHIVIDVRRTVCACKLPGLDANNPAICPTCGKPRRN